METRELWKKYEAEMFKISAYKLALSTVEFDAETIAPVKGDAYRNPRVSYLYGEMFSLQTAPEFIELLEELSTREDLSFEQARTIKWQLKDLEAIRYVPKNLYVEYSQLALESSQAWEKAKNNDDYKMFEPYLLRIIEMSKKLLEYRHSDAEGYNVYLGDYEPGMTIEKYDEFFDLIKKELVPLIKEISSKEKIRNDFVYRNYPAEIQRKMMNKILEYMNFDLEAGLISETEHPFTNSISKGDNRITTHYYENNLLSSIFSVVHEAGHATYNYQVSDELAETYLFDNMSSGMHESQSRLMENYLARRSSFWDNLFPYMKELFPEQLNDVSQSDFIKAANATECSLIRTEADELTYPLHILIRYEIEKGIFDGTVDVNDLENIWNDKYEEYLGVRPQKASEGILQDVHWSGGSFGYFPTYALGSGYAAQFVRAMSRDINIDECMRNNEFIKIKEWLKEHIHKYGGLNTPLEQIKIATGEDFNPRYYIGYLKNKYSRLYGIKK
ncbi:MAG: carboxypeptidase M32 [Erysipelotrichaceae bacterium]|nr:carboxypeptidase M32 [Erysipelotrichaceae bacterium]